MKKSTKELLTRFALLSETSLIVLSGCHHVEPICTSERPDNTSVEQTTEEPWQTNLPPYFTSLDKVDFSNENNLKLYAQSLIFQYDWFDQHANPIELDDVINVLRYANYEKLGTTLFLEDEEEFNNALSCYYKINKYFGFPILQSDYTKKENYISNEYLKKYIEGYDIAYIKRLLQGPINENSEVRFDDIASRLLNVVHDTTSLYKGEEKYVAIYLFDQICFDRIIDSYNGLNTCQLFLAWGYYYGELPFIREFLSNDHPESEFHSNIVGNIKKHVEYIDNNQDIQEWLYQCACVWDQNKAKIRLLN